MRWRIAAGLGLLAAGCGLLALSVAGLPWYRAGHGPYAPPYGGPPPRTFADLRAHFEIAHTGWEGAIYFGWLWWALLAALLALGLSGIVGVRWRAARWFSTGLGAVAALMTYTSFSDVVEAGGSVATHADAGVRVAVVGYLLAAVGAAISQPDFSRGREFVLEGRESRTATL